ncbi:hypothetical protein O6H91_Y347300 [Diphasiastrum complanatum]|nr:hypothetical protein O6H91_Y347300 [Diphasiastrum complanatum]
MGMRKLGQKVREQRERVEKRLNTVAKTAGIHHSEWVENADRWVSGFLEKFEEGCYLMEKAIRTSIKKGLIGPNLEEKSTMKLLPSSSYSKSV